MADLGGTFNAGDVDPLGDRSPIPAGDYKAIVTKSDWKQTKSGKGRYLELVIQIIEGAHKSRLLWSRLNLENPNSQAVQIARAELSSVCRAVGVMTPRDTSELHNVPFIVSVSVKKRDDNGDFTNEVKGYSSVHKSSERQQPAMTTESKPAFMSM